MWLMTPTGFYSIVQKRHHLFLTIRSRVRSDLDELRARYLPTLSKTTASADTDYRYRATVPRSALAKAMIRIINDTLYPNFKQEVERQQGPARAEVYARVWSVLHEGLPKLDATTKKTRETLHQVGRVSYSVDNGPADERTTDLPHETRPRDPDETLKTAKRVMPPSRRRSRATPRSR